MGILFSCFSDEYEGEQDPLLENQLGYNSIRSTIEDRHALEQELQQQLLQREQELTEIVNNTNDKLIDISMISNSGIVVQSQDLEEQDSKNTVDGRFNTLDSSKVPHELRKKVGKLHKDLFQELDKELIVTNDEPLIVKL
ncbi:HFL040Wp [Eremothecium sinecaudum]|uniref:HFL040Wp n=1 Tax=Eremothecium sinecaudum TaxID=45286 RepID=A0A0X8HUM3_9SACH|nr:HFL040Wp [Eremothecium sinecaudum]AMD21816.1 HFL040Wp [Eremothecium sinecaudum]